MRQTFQELIESTEIFLASKVEGKRQWCQKFWPDYVRKLKKRQGRLGDSWHIHEVFTRFKGSGSISGARSIKTAMSSLGECVPFCLQHVKLPINSSSKTGLR